MNTKRLAVALVVLGFPACGGGNTPAAPPPVTTPPTTLPNFSGAYSGLMDYNVGGLGVVRVNARTTLTHTGNTISYTPLQVSGTGVNASYPLGNATIVSGTANGGTVYQSSGCGTMNVETVTRFGPPLINLTVELRPQSCGNSRMVGELSSAPGQGGACAPCGSSADCRAGLTCQQFRDSAGNVRNLCGDANPNMTCPASAGGAEAFQADLAARSER